MMIDENFYRGKKIFITGHTGFKGAWMCCLLLSMGAQICGYALEPPTVPSLFDMLDLKKYMKSIQGDIRDLENLKKVLVEYRPEIVIHMAAQPIVRESYRNPVYTYETNVMGTVNVLEAVRNCNSVKSVINVTTDKVYLNKEWEWGYREVDELNGFDPYSNSKSCSELVTESYVNSFFRNEIAISTCRAGNVIGGGDFAKDRIIPDCIRAAIKGRNIIVRNPASIRPYQHVLEPVYAYLFLAQEQYKDIQISGAYNIGPDENSCITTKELVIFFCDKWFKYTGEKIEWDNSDDNILHEANFLKLDCAKIKSRLGWLPVWDIDTAVDKTVEWTAAYVRHMDIAEIVNKQIMEYLGR